MSCTKNGYKQVLTSLSVSLKIVRQNIAGYSFQCMQAVRVRDLKHLLLHVRAQITNTDFMYMCTSTIC